jgi:hypothetical protein
VSARTKTVVTVVVLLVALLLTVSAVTILLFKAGERTEGPSRAAPPVARYTR